MQGRRVLVTGGTGGLGHAVLRAAVARGGVVTATYREATALAGLPETLGQETFAAIEWVQADVTREADVERAITKMDRLEVLLHLVGSYAPGPTQAVSLADWQAVLDLNLTSTFVVLKHALEPIRAAKYGRIVTISSRAAIAPSAGAAAYTAAKAGVIALTQVVAEELRGIDATANCVLPSIIDTPANRKGMTPGPTPKWVAPESLAEIICFLGSAAAGSMRGAAVPVYG